MNENRVSNIDADVVAIYADSTDETVPQHLNDAVLAEARASVGPLTTWQRILNSRSVPLALVAGLALALAVVLQLTDPLSLGPGAPGGDLPAAVQAGGNADPGALVEQPPRYPCNDKQTASVESWSVCINQLEKAGRATDATAEYARMQRTFPQASIER